MYQESGLADILLEHSNRADGTPLLIYGDPAYPRSRHLRSPFKGAILTNDEQEFNRQMSSVRQSVEWGFGKIIQYFAFVDFKKNQKVLLQPVGKQYIVSAILTNLHTCLNGSPTGNTFGVNPPSVQEYLGD